MNSIHANIFSLLAGLLLLSCSQEEPEVSEEGLQQDAHREEVVMTEELNFLIRPTNSSVIASVETITPKRTSMEAIIELDGVITYDTRNVFTIPARVAGRIEQLYVKYNFQPVKKGQKLLEIYSPELITAQKELLFLLANDADNTQVIQGAKQKLRLLGASEAQINKLIQARRESYTFAIYSPYSGYVTVPGAAAQQQPGMSTPAPAGGGMDGMGGTGTSLPAASASPITTPQEFNLREGMYVDAGQTLFQVISNDELWAEFNVPAGQLQAVTKDTPVTVTVPQLADQEIKTKVDLVQPYFESGENFARVRVRIPAQPNVTLAGQLVQAQVNYTTAPSLWVPKESVLNIGTSTVAFKKSESVFIPVTVQAGQTLNGMTEILSGLSEQDVIANNAQFLVDSESFIRVRD